jgi:Fur family transcriptional regulator, zinc uptake regulator
LSATLLQSQLGALAVEAQTDRTISPLRTGSDIGVSSAIVVEAVESCQRRGLNLTPIRRRVLEVVAASPAPVSAYAIIHQLSNTKLLGPPTVYRALDFLIAAGFIRHLALRKAYVRCKWPGQPFVTLLTCSTCGDTNEVASEQMRSAVAQLAMTTGFTPHGGAIEIEGCCAACRTAKDGEASPELFNPERDATSGQVL